MITQGLQWPSWAAPRASREQEGPAPESLPPAAGPSPRNGPGGLGQNMMVAQLILITLVTKVSAASPTFPVTSQHPGVGKMSADA